MRSGMSVLAVVPARGGSKGIPRKNLCKIGGTSLIELAARAALGVTWIDAAVLSTDDAEIAMEGSRCGLEVPFMRPAELADDHATGVAAWRHAWLASETAFDRRFDCSILLQPTTPLRSADQIAATMDAMLGGGYLAAATVSKVPGHYIPEKLLSLKDGFLGFAHPEGAKFSNRQGAPIYYTRNGLCYAAMRAAVVDRMEIVENRCVGVVIEGYVANIDDPIDLAFAEFMMQRSGSDRTKA
jgi:CMP-N,N'-diacetyllegionaminic acid synthase